jgi:tRNA/rRNA methyltransferase
MKFLRVVLVRPKYPRNVGLVSRILCNYSIDHLILVAPQCEINEEAHQGAAQGQGPLRSAKIYSSWDEFIAAESNGLRIALSRRQGKRRVSEPLHHLLTQPVVDPEKPIYLLFGPEDHGLSADDLDWSHRLAFFELPGDLQSMNLSHSVLVTAQVFFQTFGLSRLPENWQPTPQQDPGPTLRRWLEALGFDLDSQTRWNMLTQLKQMVMRANPSEDEIHKLEMVVQQTVRKLQKS